MYFCGFVLSIFLLLRLPNEDHLSFEQRWLVNVSTRRRKRHTKDKTHSPTNSNKKRTTPPLKGAKNSTATNDTELELDQDGNPILGHHAGARNESEEEGGERTPTRTLSRDTSKSDLLSNGTEEADTDDEEMVLRNTVRLFDCSLLFFNYVLGGDGRSDDDDVFVSICCLGANT